MRNSRKCVGVLDCRRDTEVLEREFFRSETNLEENVACVCDMCN